ncbi:adenine phosphoribosyltransferase [Methanomassiliicoccales archaeon RumEn M1]|nr:adenine phosphoribosyltransferase [Methanomassiliicoccales archaeon RumEn M1]
MLELLQESFRRAQVMRVNSYDYIVHPLLDGVPAVEPELLEEVINAMFEMGDMDADLIVAPEAMALPLAAPLSMMSDIPYVVVRKRPYGLEDEIRIEQSTGYSNGEMYLNGVRRGDRVVVVDDVLSTGGTLRGLIKALRQAGAEVADVLVVADKGAHREELEKELGIRVQCLVRLEVRDGRVLVK